MTAATSIFIEGDARIARRLTSGAAMSDALAALAAADFVDAGHFADPWKDAPFHVDGLHGDVADRILAEFSVRTRARDSNPAGRVLCGGPGVGKTHLLSTLRRRVWEGGGWFVRLDLSGCGDFWRAVALGFVDSLSRRMDSRLTQAGAALVAALRAVSSDPAVREAASRAGPQLVNRGPIDHVLAVLAAAEPAEARRWLDAARALAFSESRDDESCAIAGLWLQGEAVDAARLEALGFAGPSLSAEEIVRGLMWLMSLGGPTLIVVQGLDALAGDAGERLQTLADVVDGLAQLHAAKRRALTLVCGFERTWSLVQPRLPAGIFRAASPLAPVDSAEIVERLIAARLAPAHAQASFSPPYPAFPFTRGAALSAVGLTPREILRRVARRRDACLAEDVVREYDSLAEANAERAASPEPAGAEAFDEIFAHALAEAAPPDLHDESALGGLIGAACGLYARQFEASGSPQMATVGNADRRHALLHAEIVFGFPEESGRQFRVGFRALTEGDARAFRARLGAAMTASGLEAGAPGRRLVILRETPPPSEPKAAAAARAFVDAGGLFVAPDARDFALFAALRGMARTPDARFEAWLRRRKPLLQTRLFEAAGMAPARFLDPAATKPSRVSPRPVSLTPPPSLKTLAAPARVARDEIFLGRAAGETAQAVGLPVALLPRHLALFADSGAPRSAWLARFLGEAALLGAPSVVVDRRGDVRESLEPGLWKASDDARKAEAFAEQVGIVVWTPGGSGGRPLDLPLLPDLAALSGGREQRERAVEMTLAGLEPFLLGKGAKAIKLRGTLADALRAFARAGGGSLDDLVRWLQRLPEGASRIAEADALAREIAEQLLGAMATDPLLQAGAEPFDPAQLYDGERGRTRVSVVDLSGLGGDAARGAFVHRLQSTLGAWIAQNPSAAPRLYALDDAEAFAPARRSALALVEQGRKSGLAAIFAAQDPRALDPALLSACLTQVYGRIASPAAREAAAAMLTARGGAADDLDGLAPGEFFVTTEGWASPVRLAAASSPAEMELRSA